MIGSASFLNGGGGGVERAAAARAGPVGVQAEAGVRAQMRSSCSVAGGSGRGRMCGAQAAAATLLLLNAI